MTTVSGNDERYDKSFIVGNRTVPEKPAAIGSDLVPSAGSQQ